MMLVAPRAAAAQTDFYNLDSGRPTRVEDAVPTPWRELELQLFPLRLDWLGGGIRRQRAEPKLSYGVLPLTELEVRFPIVRSASRTTPETIGLASSAIGVLHAFNVETRWPALALAGEVVLPVGSLAAPTASYAVKGLITKTFRVGRVQLNAGGGTWAIRLPKPGPVVVPNQCGDPGQPPCLPPDVPCTIIPVSSGGTTSLACAPSSLTTLFTSAAPGQRPTGAHWSAALGVDHTFPFWSTLVAANVAWDRFDGLFPLDDWTAEIGIRRQLTPQLVGDLGVGRRFAGTTQATSVTGGVTFAMPVRW